jgi:hypothetical protein
MLENINYILIDLFTGIMIYILAIFIGIFIKRNNEFIVPIIFGLMFCIYTLFRSFSVIKYAF